MIRLVSFGEHPEPRPGGFVETFMSKVGDSDDCPLEAQLPDGAPVRVIGGIFDDLTGSLLSSRPQERVVVLLGLFSGPRRVTLPRKPASKPYRALGDQPRKRLPLGRSPTTSRTVQISDARAASHCALWPSRYSHVRSTIRDPSCFNRGRLLATCRQSLFSCSAHRTHASRCSSTKHRARSTRPRS